MNTLTRRKFILATTVAGTALCVSVKPDLITACFKPKTSLQQYIIHDIFLGWLYGNRSNLKVDIIPGRRKEDTMTLSFSFLKTYIKGCINADEDNGYVELTVVAEDPDTDFGWDILFEGETSPKLTNKGWICKDCAEYEGNKGKELPKFSSLEELLEYHVFNPFLEFVNEKLTKTDALGFVRYGRGTWIKFAEDLSDPPSTVGVS